MFDSASFLTLPVSLFTFLAHFPNTMFGFCLPGSPIPVDLFFQFIVGIEIHAVTPVAHAVISLLRWKSLHELNYIDRNR